jgi:hypothetical protein
MRHRGRTDANHALVREVFRQLGAEVLDLAAVGGGCPDLLVHIKTGRRAGSLHLIEVKDGSKSPSHRQLTPAQAEFHKIWPVHVVNSLDQVVELCGTS